MVPNIMTNTHSMHRASKIIAISNPEKSKHEVWDKNRDLIDWPRPMRWCILGSVSCGKTSLILNYLINSHPYDNIFLLHPQTYNPNVDMEDEAKNKNIIVKGVDIPEYKGVKFIGLSYIPSMTYFDDIKNKYNLLIIDDIDLTGYLKKHRDIRDMRLNKIFSYVSSHKNVSIIVTSQDASSQLPAMCLKMCNVNTIYKQKDEYVVQTLARKLSISYKRLKALLDLCKTNHDSITFDQIENSPAELRLNIYDPITEH